MKKKIEITFGCDNNKIQQYDDKIQQLLHDCIDALEKITPLQLKSVTVDGNLYYTNN